MRSIVLARPSTAVQCAHPEARCAMTALAALTLVAVVLGSAPTTLGAQAGSASGAAQEAPGTYTVKRGDTLWEIARRVLGDPTRWREIAQLNAESVGNARKLPPGLVLRLPGAGPSAVAGALPSAQTAADRRDAAESAAAPAPVQQQPLPDAASQERTETPTVFAASSVRRSTAPRSGNVIMMKPLAVRRGEFEAAPYLSRVGGPPGSGRILDPVDQSNLLSTQGLAERRMQIRERTAIRPPAGPALVPGDYLVAYRLGDILDGRQVVIPTGVLRVDEAVRGRAPVARLLREFDVVTAADRIVRYEGIETDSVRPIAVAVGRTTRVLGIFGNDLVPAVQSFVFFPLTSKDGMRPGDQLTLFHAARRDEGSLVPEVDIAEVTLLRVTEYGATGMVIGQSSSRFAAGTYARVSARLP